MAELVLPQKEVYLVVHSSWRATHSTAELQQLLGPVGKRCVGATTRRLDRQRSILDFVARHRLALTSASPAH